MDSPLIIQTLLASPSISPTPIPTIELLLLPNAFFPYIDRASPKIKNK